MLGPHGYIVQLNCSAGRLLLLASCLQQRQRQQHVLAPAAQVAPLLLLMLLVCSTQQLPSLNLGPAAAAAAAAPTLDLALWNQAYQLIVEDIPVRPDPPTAHAASQISSAAADDPSNWDTALSIPSSCSSSGYDTIDPASVPLNACFYKVALRSNGASNGVAAAARAAAAVAHAVPPAAAALASAQSGVSNTTKSSNTWQQASHLQLGSNSDAGSSSSSGRRLLAYSDSNKTVSYWQKLAGDLRRNTNCYCYALDLRQNGFCTPGASTGLDKQWEQGRSPFTCESVKTSMAADGALPANRSAVFAAEEPGTGHFIAVFTRASGCAVACWESDYHMLRRDSNGQWSYKEPGGPAKNVDLFNSVITDPETAVIPGRYTFCAYFLVDLRKMRIGGTFSDTTLREKVENMNRQRTPGVVVGLRALPYNAETDGAYNARQQQTYTQDATLLQLPVEQQQAAALKLYQQQRQKQMQQQGAQQQRQGAQHQQQQGSQQQQQQQKRQQQQQMPSEPSNNGSTLVQAAADVGRKLMTKGSRLRLP